MALTAQMAYGQAAHLRFAVYESDLNGVTDVTIYTPFTKVYWAGVTRDTAPGMATYVAYVDDVDSGRAGEVVFKSTHAGDTGGVRVLVIGK